MSKAPFACVVTNGRQVWYRTLLEAVESSTTMLENDVPHRLLARDIHGEMQELGQGWRPDCVCGQEDSLGGILNNQYAAAVLLAGVEVELPYDGFS